MMTKPLSLDSFLNEIKYKPIFVNYDKYDDVYLVEFRHRNKKEPSLEFSNHIGDNGYQCIYFEILDFNGYAEGEMISMNSPRRLSVTTNFGQTEKDVLKYAKIIEDMLRELYSETDR